MKDKVFFISSIIFALSVPIIIGGMYFYNIYSKEMQKKYVAEINIKPEIIANDTYILSGLREKIISEDDFLKVPSYDFDVRYNGIYSRANYMLFLDDITMSDIIDKTNFRWVLTMENGGTYIKVKSGNYYDIINEKLSLSPNIDINRNQTQKFKLYYYLISDLDNAYNDFEFSAKIKIE